MAEAGLAVRAAATQLVVRIGATNDHVALDAAEREHLAEIVESALRVQRIHDLFLWLQGPVQRLIPHEILVFGIAGSGGAVAFQRLRSSRHMTDEHFKELCRPGQGLIVQMMSRWARVGAPSLLSPALRTWDCDDDWLSLAQKHELRNVAAHGVRCADGRVASYFSFSRVDREFGSKLCHVLSLLIPHLHETLTRVTINEGRTAVHIMRNNIMVTDREREILRWIRDGKTNQDIASLLELSPYTVKNHMQKILRKMGVENRSHAVARAISLGILASF